jgi:CheY-like chemotaxis protein
VQVEGLNGVKILILETNEDNSQSIGDWIRFLLPRAAVYAVRDHNDAIRLGRQHRPDVILVDTRFYGQAGSTMVRSLKKSLNGATFVVLADGDQDHWNGIPEVSAVIDRRAAYSQLIPALQSFGRA